MPVVERNDAGGRRQERAARGVKRGEAAGSGGARARHDATLHLTMNQVFVDSPDTLLLGTDRIVGQGRPAKAATPARQASAAPPDLASILAEIRRIISGPRTEPIARPQRRSSGWLLLLLAGLAVAYWFHGNSDLWSLISGRDSPAPVLDGQVEPSAISMPATTMRPPMQASHIPADSPLRWTNMGGALRVEQIIFSGRTCARKLAERLHWPVAVSRFDCDCFFGILYEEQVSVARLPTSDKLAQIVNRARTYCSI